jgi:hypothetical protein
MGLAGLHIYGAHAWSSVMGVTFALKNILKCVKNQPPLWMAMCGTGGGMAATRSHGANEHVVLFGFCCVTAPHWLEMTPRFKVHYAMQGQLHFQQWMGGSLQSISAVDF